MLGNRSRTPLGGEHLFRVATDEEIFYDAGTLHAGKRFNLFEHAIVKTGTLSGYHRSRSGQLD